MDDADKMKSDHRMSDGDKTRASSAAAQRALEEAAARRRAAGLPPIQTEIQGRGGLDPARYGDWEVKGLASDF